VWTPDDTTVFVSGTGGPVLAYRPDDTQAVLTTLPDSHSFAVW
jgi:hypothetical protein